MTTLGLLIGGQAKAASGEGTFERRNPFTGEVATTAAAASVEDAKAAADAAGRAFATWSQTGPGERRGKLLKAAELMEARQAEFIERMVNETGATPGWAGFNVMVAAGMLREAASLTTQIQGDVIPSNVPDNLAMGIRVPCGVVVGIAPWNAPIILGTRAVATPLACGNTVILKASEQCPATHHLIGEVLVEAGLGEGVVNVVTNAPHEAPQIVETLIAHPEVARINFTGSTGVGRIIAEKAAHHLKPVLLELGGKAPFLVLDDADLDAALDGAMVAKMRNAGEACTAANRFYVQSGIYDAFVKGLTGRMAALRIGAGADAQTQVGPMITAKAVQKIDRLVADALERGARATTGGKPIDGKGFFYPPTVLENVPVDALLAHEEIFGPVAPVFRFDTEDQAVQRANDTEYGLAAYVYSQDITRAMRVGRQIETGMLGINRGLMSDPAAPFGGVKQSGLGREGGVHGIMEFMEPKYYAVNF